MKLAVYARALTRMPTGRGAVAQEILLAMLGANLPVQVDLYAAEEPNLDLRRMAFHPARGKTFFEDLWKSLFSVGASIRSLRPDVLWCPTHVLPAGLPGDLPKVTTVLDVVWKDHPETVSFGRCLQEPWAERCLHAADAIACISRFTESRVLHHYPELEGKTHVLPLAANPRFKRIPDAADRVFRRWGIDRPFLLSVGTLEPRKNFELLLDALPFLEPILVIHCGPEGWKTGAVVRRARHCPAIRLLGYIPETELNELYSAATVAIFPSVYEGFNLPALDAASVGCPVLASDIPVHREVLGGAADYFPLGSPSSLAEAIGRVIRSDNERSRLSACGPERARAFNWDSTARSLFALLEKVADGRPNA